MEQNPLDQLRDIHLPESGGFWPPAPGWWALAVLVLIAGIVLVMLFRRWRRRTRWLVVARREMEHLARTRSPTPEWFAQLNTLLKQCARKRYPLERPGALTGQQWADFLLRTSPHDRIASRPVVEAMIQSAWQPRAATDPDRALAFARLWLGGQT
ncbi:DUF4381 domain-containing protein [Marinobacter sp.]|uniref:DUF4381 domain-containing protein n=1 Tax=Marinobacter sp. TaxID=50741 RepID=UPI0034A1CF3B